MAVLYRKYRPGTFSDVAGQEHVKKTLAYEVASGKLAHSYLFTGPRGVGKTTTARILAKAVNCQDRKKGSAEPCGACASCTEIAEGRNLDVIEIDAASHTGVDNVREHVIENARFAPTRSAYKVFIIDEVHMLSTAAFNALLKTLEEPPAHCIFILATTELHKLPATVISRCQRFDFRKIGHDDLTGRLKALLGAEKAKVDDDVIEAVVRHSDGCLRDAESLLSQLLSMGEKRVTADAAALIMPVVSSESIRTLAEALIRRDAPRALVLWEHLAAGGADLGRILAELIDVCRQSALSRMKGVAHALVIEPGEATALIQKLMQAREEMRRTEIPELPFELLVMEWSAPPEKGVWQGAKGEDRHDEPPMPPAPTGKKHPTPALVTPSAAEGSAVPEAAGHATQVAGASLDAVRSHWTQIVNASQSKHHAFPFMLAAAELLSCENGTLTIGVPYAMYRDRLNDRKHRPMLEEAVQEATSAKVSVSVVLTARGADGSIETAPNIVVKPAANLPEGFAELVKEFGGTVG